MSIKKMSKNIYLIFSLIVFGGMLYLYNISADYLNTQKPVLLGNTPSVIEQLKKSEGKTPFSFAFISDMEGNDDSIWLIKTLLNQLVDFLVFVGDFVNDSILSEHKLFMYNISRFGPKVPIFLVPGNHDIGNKDRGEFSKADFESVYGPLNYSFKHNDCLFIFLNNINRKDGEASKYLENVLSRKNRDIEHTFLFCHTPVNKVLNKMLLKDNEEDELSKLIEKYKINYVISGDYHRHYELTSGNGTKYIVSGSGGSHYHEAGPFGRFKSGTKITVYNDGITEEMIINDKIGFTDNSIRHFIYNKIMPFFELRVWLVNCIFALAIINLLFSMYWFIRNIKI